MRRRGCRLVLRRGGAVRGCCRRVGDRAGIEIDLDDAICDRLAQVLGGKLEREVNVSTTTDSDLLGGVLIRAGDTVIDGSVRGRLNKLAEAMNS